MHWEIINLNELEQKFLKEDEVQAEFWKKGERWAKGKYQTGRGIEETLRSEGVVRALEQVFVLSFPEDVCLQLYARCKISYG